MVSRGDRAPLGRWTWRRMVTVRTGDPLLPSPFVRLDLGVGYPLPSGKSQGDNINECEEGEEEKEHLFEKVAKSRLMMTKERR